MQEMLRDRRRGVETSQGGQAVTFLTSRTDSADDLRTANQADSSKLSADARYGFEERLGILAGNRTPTASQVALAWREAVEFDRRKGAA